MSRYICIHGHFYQPPRENPWLEEIEFQDSAYPHHDWNERITAECYAPNAASRILDSEGRIIDIVNIYSRISFDFGPTLLSWLERHRPEVYQAIIEADSSSMERFSGHGSAIAHAYNHMILPLASSRDKYTQILWGIRDFEKRFTRFPEGMWLPETAVDMETLEVLAELGIKFAVLAPRQAQQIRKSSHSRKWINVSGENIDPTAAYRCDLPSGKHINLFFYDGPISHDVSFGDLLKNGEDFANRLLSAFNDSRDWPQIVHIATDGETFGHHHHYGEMALSYALHYIESGGHAKLANYGEYLEKHPPVQTVEIHENSSWSCAHGVERWRSDCGCSSGMHQDWTQAWRGPLRDSLDFLREEFISTYNEEACKYLSDPWDTRNDYIHVVLDRSRERIENFIEKHSSRELSAEEKIRVLKLLEIQRHAMLMYTSCGWFFDEISGIETIQILQYALKAIQYAEELTGSSLEAGFLNRLRKARSNVFRDIEEMYDRHVRSAKTDLLRVGAHYSISSVFEEYPQLTEIYCYTAESDEYKKVEAGRMKFAAGQAKITSNVTLEQKSVGFAVLHLGDHNINAGVKDFNGKQEFLEMQHEVTGAFEKGDIPEVVRLMDRHFENNIYSMWYLFKEEQRKVLDHILQHTYESVEASYRHIYEDNFAIMSFYHTLQHRLPRPFHSAAEYVLNTDLKRIFDEKELDVDKLGRLIDETEKWSVHIDKTTIGFVASSWITSVMKDLAGQPEDMNILKRIDNTMEELTSLSLPLDLWEAQNIYFSAGRNLYSIMTEKSYNGDRFAKEWLESFSNLGSHLHVKI